MAHPDFRALCAELVEEMELFGFDDEYSGELLKKARAALAVPKLNPLSDSQLEGFFMQNAQCVAGSTYVNLKGFIQASRAVISKTLANR